MRDYIVEFRKGDEVLETTRFSSLDGMDGAEFHILMNSLDRNLDSESNWMIRQERGDWFKKYDNKGNLVSVCGVDPIQLVLDKVMPSLSFKSVDSSGQEHAVSMKPLVCRRTSGEAHSAALLVEEGRVLEVHCDGGCCDCPYEGVEWPPRSTAREP